ncbi:dephospho-CoA kinase [Linderina pennispora]|uniref:Dephospho-CoA kinase n=1 Tax=Linderina pennispora TaxID=61395 RepID=A0A1Y1W1K8_9FUNG|nr:dephospho-CoA kinase [Linderina pennispora]ORX67378.1 dephospho-CoA kinase [Linderina pennispora]
MLIVGLTGGIATGKSTVSNGLRAQGVPVIDADTVAHQLMEPGETPYRLVVQHFGPGILRDDATIDRARLGAEIFGDAAKRQLLNRCTHPYVRRRMLVLLLGYYVRGHAMCVLDVPLLFESGLDRLCGKVAVVACAEDRQLARLMARNALSGDEAAARIAAQMPLDDKIRRATRVIDNNGSVEETMGQVQTMVREWRPSWLSTFGALLAPVGLVAALPLVRTSVWGLGVAGTCAAWLVGSALGVL